MKKIVATTLACAMMFSLAACSGKQPEQTTATVSETTAETTAETSETAQTEPSATATTVYNPASEFVKDRTEKVPDPNRVDEDGEVDESDIFVYHLPELQIKSSYADAVNKEINAAFEKYKKNYNNADEEQFYSTEYIAYLTKEGILSLVLISNGEYECNEYKVYNIDTKTGEKVDNARIAKTAGVSSIRKAAMDALQNLYNKMEIFQFKDYKIVLKKGEKKDSQMKDVEKTFSEKHLNDTHWTSHFDLAATLMQDVLGVTNDVSDYTVGRSLFDTTKRDYMVCDGYNGMAITEENGNITDLFYDGNYQITDQHLNHLTNQPLDTNRVNQVLRTIESFYQH